MKGQLLIVLFLIIGCQFLFAQEIKPKNPILTDKFIINLGIYSPLNEVKISANGTVIENDKGKIDFNEKFNLDDTQTTFSAAFTWRFARNWNVSTDYFKIKRENGVTLKEDITWNDLTFKEGTGIKGGFNFALYRVVFGRVISKGDKHELGAGLGAHTITIKPFIEGQAYINDSEFEFRRSEVSATLPLPNIGIWYIWAPTPKLSLTTKIDWFGIKINDISGLLWDVNPMINYQVFRNVGISAGYKYLHFGVDIDKEKWNGEIDLQFQGPSISVFGNF